MRVGPESCDTARAARAELVGLGKTRRPLGVGSQLRCWIRDRHLSGEGRHTSGVVASVSPAAPAPRWLAAGGDVGVVGVRGRGGAGWQGPCHDSSFSGALQGPRHRRRRTRGRSCPTVAQRVSDADSVAAERGARLRSARRVRGFHGAARAVASNTLTTPPTMRKITSATVPPSEIVEFVVGRVEDQLARRKPVIAQKRTPARSPRGPRPPPRPQEHNGSLGR